LTFDLSNHMVIIGLLLRHGALPVPAMGMEAVVALLVR